jgi:hypothetical protein
MNVEIVRFHAIGCSLLVPGDCAHNTILVQASRFAVES